MSERTAKFHVSNLLVKHGVRRRADLLFCALKNAGQAHPRSGGDGEHSSHVSAA